MPRLTVDRKLHWDVLRARGADLLLFSALIVVGLSYGLGYRLDWSEEAGRTEDIGEVAEVPAPAASGTPLPLQAESVPVSPAPPAVEAPVATMSAPP
ncbi:MAG: hypothetical protein ACHQ49_11175, partial [Elusimicrobiota bacterium]